MELPSGQAMESYDEVMALRAEAEAARTQAEADRDRFAAKLRELGIDPTEL